MADQAPRMMRAIVVERPGELRLRDDVPVPTPGDFEALVRIEACGVCSSTDRHIIDGTMCHHPADAYPAILGHEGVGVVVAVGRQVKKFKVGDRVTRPAAIWPGTKSSSGLWSAWGGFAEYGVVRDGPALAASGDLAAGGDYTMLRQNVVPAGISPADASLAISVSEIASWMWKLGPVGGKSLAVMGTGFAALAMVILAKLAGAGPIVVLGRRDERLAHARRCGADATINITCESDIRGVVHRVTQGGADYAAEATGVDAMLVHVLESLRPGGMAAIYGAPRDYRYTLPLRSAGGEFSLRLINADEHLAYAHVCDLLSRQVIDATLLRSHVWHGIQSVPGAFDTVARGEVSKGIVVFDS